MMFPVTLAFAGAWRVHLSITDASGALLGYSPLKMKDGSVRIYSDESMRSSVYAMKWDPLTRLFTLLDAQGAAFGRLEVADTWSPAYTISVRDEPRFQVTEYSPAMHFVDGLFDPVPFVNVVTGMVFKPCHEVKRRDTGEKVMTMVKKRTALDASYVMELDGAVDAGERECILVSAALIATRARRSASPGWY